MSYVEYDHNNSGGDWWLKDADWKALEEAGWEVDWRVGRWLGALATSAKRRGLSLKEAADEFERVTNQDLSDEGCNCCGAPHSMSEYDDNDRYVRSVEIVRSSSWDIW